jgi:hypothetical protein
MNKGNLPMMIVRKHVKCLKPAMDKLSPMYVTQIVWKNWKGIWDQHNVKISTAENLRTAANIHELLARNCQLTLKLVEDHLHVKWWIIFHVLHDNLGVGKICTKWIPHSLLDEHRVTTCEDLSTLIKLFQSILIAQVLRQVLVFQYQPHVKAWSREWSNQ